MGVYNATEKMPAKCVGENKECANTPWYSVLNMKDSKPKKGSVIKRMYTDEESTRPDAKAAEKRHLEGIHHRRNQPEKTTIVLPRTGDKYFNKARVSGATDYNTKETNNSIPIKPTERLIRNENKTANNTLKLIKPSEVTGDTPSKTLNLGANT